MALLLAQKEINVQKNTGGLERWKIGKKYIILQ